MGIFNKDSNEQVNQLAQQIGNVTDAITGLQQQLSNQQQSIDQIRQDATAAINTGLGEVRTATNAGLVENRTVTRDELAQIRDRSRDQITHMASELAAIRTGLSELDARVQTVIQQRPAEADSDSESGATEPSPDTDDIPAPDEAILQAAAGISAATFHIHRDTWAFLVEHAGTDPHFRLPGHVQEDAGAVTVQLSGPSLVAAITGLHHTAHSAAAVGTRAMARYLHHRLADTVRTLLDEPHRGSGADPITLTIDDRTPEPDQTDEDRTS